jgi:hypothetical protein
MMETTITVDFPKPVYQRLQRQSRVMKIPIAEIVVQTVRHRLPLWLETIPPDFEKELAQLDDLSIAQVQKIAKSRLPSAKQRKLDKLLQKNSEGTITMNELSELDNVQLEANFLMLKKAKALALLKSLGYPLPLKNARR